MESTTNFLAFDLGAESGRAIVGKLGGGRLTLDVIHRFSNIPVRVADGLHWDALRLFQEMKDGLRMSCRDGAKIASAGLDTWGVDFALLDKTGALLGNPIHYRDTRTEGAMEEVFAIVPREEVFRRTGIQFMQLNTLYQLYVMNRDNPALLDAAEKILMLPDLLNYWFTGEAVCEFTEATTSQCFDPRQGGWATDMLDKLGLPAHKLGPIVQPGSRLGNLAKYVCEDCDAAPIPLIAPACHDTGSAVAAVPAEGGRFAYISSGTWSLVGIEVDQPVINDRSLKYNFTNEGGVAGTYRLLKNVMGLWIVQECRRQWEREGVSYDYAKLTEMASEAAPFGSLLDPDSVDFFAPGDMPGRIRDYCRRTGQRIPESPGEVVRAALDSLALKYRWVLERLEELTGHPIPVVHIVGGGTQNTLLSQLTADTCARDVICGPVEATAVGNVLMQAVGLGVVASISDARKIVRDSFELARFIPTSDSGGAASEAYERFLGLLRESHSQP